MASTNLDASFGTSWDCQNHQSLNPEIQSSSHQQSHSSRTHHKAGSHYPHLKPSSTVAISQPRGKLSHKRNGDKVGTITPDDVRSQLYTWRLYFGRFGEQQSIGLKGSYLFRRAIEGRIGVCLLKEELWDSWESSTRCLAGDEVKDWSR